MLRLRLRRMIRLSVMWRATPRAARTVHDGRLPCGVAAHAARWRTSR
jgi:hypothetical protein